MYVYICDLTAVLQSRAARIEGRSEQNVVCAIASCSVAALANQSYTVKKVSDLPAPRRDVTNQTLPGKGIIYLFPGHTAKK
jgi:hypothetical protein